MSFFKKKSLEHKKRPTPSLGDEGKQSPHHWSLFEEGHLLVDMYETADTVVVRSFVAGVNPENIEISMHHDMLTIRGKRHDEETIHDDRFFHRECYWGVFSRSIIIPKQIDTERIRAHFKNGVVTIVLPKLESLETSIQLEAIHETETPIQTTG